MKKRTTLYDVVLYLILMCVVVGMGFAMAWALNQELAMKEDSDSPYQHSVRVQYEHINERKAQ